MFRCYFKFCRSIDQPHDSQCFIDIYNLCYYLNNYSYKWLYKVDFSCFHHSIPFYFMLICKRNYIIIQVDPTSIGVTCSYSKNLLNQTQLKAVVTAPISSYFELNVNNFQNPSTTTPTTSFNLSTYDSSNDLLDNQSTLIILTATAAALESASLKSSSNIIGASATLTVSLQVTNPVPINGQIQMTFPYWNPTASGTNYALQSYITNTNEVACSGLLLIQGTPLCSFNTNTQTLSVSGLTQALSSGSKVSFSVQSFRNPITSILQTGFTVATSDSIGGLIDEATASLSATQSTTLTSPSLTLDTYLIQTSTIYRLEFTIPIPLSSGCQIEINFPSLIPLIASELTLVQSFGLPNTQRSLTGYIDTSSNSFLITNACPTYRDYQNSAILYFQNITNPFFQTTTSTIEVQVTDSNGILLASTANQGPTLTTIPGTIDFLPIISSNTQVSSIGSMEFSLQPQQSSYSISKLVIGFPINDILIQPTCTVSSINILASGAECIANTTTNTATLLNIFTSEYSLQANEYIQFSLIGIQMPVSVAQTGTFTYSIYSFYTTSYELIGTGSGSNLTIATSGTILSGSVVPDSFLAFATTNYTISIKTQDPIPIKGYFKFLLPSQISILAPSSSKCSHFVGITNSSLCSITSSSITITNCFQTQGVNSSFTFSFKVSGIINPRSLQPSSSFQAFSYDQYGSLIDEKLDQMTVTMISVNNITSASVQTLDTIVGDLTQYIFNVQSPTQLLTGDKIYVQFPPEIGNPVANTLTSCVGQTNMQNSLSCQINGPYGVMISAAFNGGSLSANSQFSFFIQVIQNPSSTKPTSKFNVMIYDSLTYTINNANTNIPYFYVTMATGAPFLNITVINQSKQSGVMTGMEFIMTLRNDLPANAQISIIYPSQVSADASDFTCISSAINSSPICTINVYNRIITMQAATFAPLPAGQILNATFFGMINPTLATATSSFQVTTLTPDGYIINYAYSGITLTTSCNLPCLTCVASEPTRCLSCDSTSQYSILLDGSCIAKCPSQYFSANQLCYPCDSSCFQCSGSADYCTSCNPDTFLQNNVCVTECSSAQAYQNSLTWTCDECLEPCLTCSGTTQTCTSCSNLGNFQNLYNGKCVTTCPSQTTVNIDNVCEPCDSNCATCTDLPTLCASCPSGQKLDLLDMSCTTTCPQGTTVDIGTQCALCDSSCKTCASTNASYCLSCPYGLSLYSQTNQCLAICPNGTVSTAVNGQSVCQPCAEGCISCQYNSTYCTICNATQGYNFFDFTCVTSCPAKYVRLSSTQNVCIKDGTWCPFGYEYNNFGQCELDLQVCNKGYTLNAQKTKCIPIPGAYIPFIFIILCSIYTVVIVVKFRKVYSKIVIISQLLCFYTTAQTLQYIIMMPLTIALDYQLLFAFHLIALISMFLTNIVFTILLKVKLRKSDAAFKHWWFSHKIKPMRYYQILMTCVNFKLVRGLYSQFKIKGSDEYFNVGCDSKYRTLIKPLFIATMLNFVLQVSPVLIMDIYNFIFVEWGYQIMVMSVDNFILAIVIFILEIIEFAYYKKEAFSNDRHQEPSFIALNGKGNNRNQQVNVMSAVQDEDSSLIALKQLNDYSVIGMNDSITTIMDLKKLGPKAKKKEISDEAALLNQLVKRMNEQQKLKRIYEDIEGEQGPVEVMDPNKPLIFTDPQQKKPGEVREKIENILGQRGKVAIYLKEKLIQEEKYAEYATKDKEKQEEQENQTLTERKEPQVNLESARTEKFNHQQSNTKQPPSINVSQIFAPTTKGGPEETLSKQDDQEDQEPQFDPYQKEIKTKQQIELYNNFFKEHKRRLEKERNFKDYFPREWESFDENAMREIHDDMELESDFDDHVSNISIPMKPSKFKTAQEWAELEVFRENLKSQYHFNNVYAHRKGDPLEDAKKMKNVTRRTQTYEKDVGTGLDPFDNVEEFLTIRDQDVFPEIDISYVEGLFDDVIYAISDKTSQELAELAALEAEMNPGLKQDEGDEASDFDFNEGANKQQTKKRKKDINFDLDDIMGMFDIDDFGGIMFDRVRMRDNLNRRVNKHGYLSDSLGNIINQDGDIIFEMEELDEDGDIPLPHRFEKRKKQLLKQEERFDGDEMAIADFDPEAALKNEDEKVEEEFNKLQDLSKQTSLDSLIGDAPGHHMLELDQQEDGQFNLMGQGVQSKRTSASKKDRDLARAYGGKPPNSSRKKKKKKSSPNNDGDRLPTDRLFPNFIKEEEERLKKLTKLAFISERTNPNNQLISEPREIAEEKDFEEYFRDQMEGIQQYRQQERDQLRMSKEVIKDSNQTRNRNLDNAANQESASTQKTLNKFWEVKLGSNSNLISGNNQVIDPLQELVMGHQNKDLQSRQDQITPPPQRINQNATFQKLPNQLNYSSGVISGGYITNTLSQPKINANNKINSQLSIRNQMQEEMVDDDIQPSDLNNQQNNGQNINRRTGFEFYLPSKTQIKKNFLNPKREASNFPSIGQMQVTGDSKIKGLERLYLQKYPQAPQTAQQFNNPRTMSQVTNLGVKPLLTSHVQKKARGTMRTAMSNSRENRTEMGFRPQIGRFFYGNDQDQDEEFKEDNIQNVGNAPRDQIGSVFEGVGNILNNIERLRGGLGTQSSGITEVGSVLEFQNRQPNSTTYMNRQAPQNNNWI